MKSLRDLTDYIKKNKKFDHILAGEFDGVDIPVTTYAYDSQDKIFYFLCEFDDSPIYASTILKEVYKYPVVSIRIMNEDLRQIKDVKSFHTTYGVESFGEPNMLVML